jgi:hypothetical protein
MSAQTTIETRTETAEVWYTTRIGYKVCAVCADPDPATGDSRHPEIEHKTWGPDNDFPGSPCEWCGKTQSALEFEARVVVEYPPCRIF